MAAEDDDEELQLRAVVRQNAEAISVARQRAERDLIEAKEALEARTAQLAESLAMMQATLESTADGILVTDDSRRVTGFNRRLTDMWRIPQDVLAARDHERMLAVMAAQTSDSAAFMSSARAILSGSPAESFDLLELADGRVFERYTRVQTLEDRVIGRVWSYRDVTERARSVAALREAKAEAEAANRAKSVFLAMMSHELRTPLNAIAGYAELIDMGLHGPVTDAQHRSIDRIQSSQRHLLGLIDEVLIHATLEAGTVSYRLERVAAAETVEEAASLVRPQAAARGVTLDVVACDAAVAARADTERTHRILVNLLTNAIKFTDRGGRVEVRCTEDDGHVRITVTDTGVGIPADQLDAIFEPFVQVRSELTRTAQGSGLGLAISRALARGMAGDLVVESTPGSGSAFTLLLPAH